MSTRMYQSRRLLRQREHSYQARSSYFITMCTRPREPIFVNPELRTILEKMWFALPERFPHVTLDEYIIMPDHVHGILHFHNASADAPSLGRVIGAYKSLVSVAWLRHIEAHNLSLNGRFWQTGYHDRVIRDQQELAEIRQYIRNNPKRWQEKYGSLDGRHDG